MSSPIKRRSEISNAPASAQVKKEPAGQKQILLGRYEIHEVYRKELKGYNDAVYNAWDTKKTAL